MGYLPGSRDLSHSSWLYNTLRISGSSGARIPALVLGALGMNSAIESMNENPQNFDSYIFPRETR
jgi:hypothetical protein